MRIVPADNVIITNDIFRPLNDSISFSFYFVHTSAVTAGVETKIATVKGIIDGYTFTGNSSAVVGRKRISVCNNADGNNPVLATINLYGDGNITMTTESDLKYLQMPASELVVTFTFQYHPYHFTVNT